MPLSIIKLKQGMLLVASPNIERGIFKRSVIVLCEHQTDGSFGLILNKTMDTTFPSNASQR